MLLLILSSLAGACVRTDRGLGDLTVASNGTVAAYWYDSVSAFGSVHTKEFACSAYVRWIDLDHPIFVRSKLIYAKRESFCSLTSFVDRALAFSPDSKYIGVRIGGELHCVDPQSSKTWQLSLPEEYVSSFCWVGNDEIAYARVGPDGGVFKRRVQEPSPNRVPVLQGSLPPLTLLPKQLNRPWEELIRRTPHEWWAPNGRFVIVAWGDQSIHLFDTESGIVRSYERPFPSVAVGWKPDSSMCLVALGDTDFKPGKMFLLSPIDGSIRDLTDPFVETFKSPERKEVRRSSWAIDVQALGESIPRAVSLDHGDNLDWTADGKFVIISSPMHGACLVRPDPWEVVELGSGFATAMRDTEAYRQAVRLHKKETLFSLSVLPVAGWVKAWMGGHEYAVNYERNEAVELAAYIISAASPAVVTNDGHRVVTLDILGNLKVSPLDLSKAPVVAKW
ncbi:MAG: hypothetical protein V1790_01375 [Planctomycetota bacterium]